MEVGRLEAIEAAQHICLERIPVPYAAKFAQLAQHIEIVEDE